MHCPCGSLLSYAQCCELLHINANQFASSATQLMRSRYSAFALGNADYIVQTTLPAQQALLDINAIRNWSEQNQWLGLTIVSTQPHIKPRHAQVEFIAQFKSLDNPSDRQIEDQQIEDQQIQSHQELSSFVQLANQRWYFLDPNGYADSKLPVKPSLKSTCPCGSGQKFKRCCAPFLGLLD